MKLTSHEGGKSSNFKALVDFIYFGEANVFQDELDIFLALAEELQLKGLDGSSNAPDECVKGSFSQNEMRAHSNQKQNVPQTKLSNGKFGY